MTQVKATDVTVGTQTALSAERFATAPYHIPGPRDADGRLTAYKTELVLERSLARVEKVLWWHGPDPRREPHNHPWAIMRSTILKGGFTETRWSRDPKSGLWSSRQLTHVAGDVYECPNDEYHTVDEVVPGTVTHLVCTDTVPNGDWGYINPEHKLVEHMSTKSPDLPENLKAPNFFAEFCEINPHKRG